MADFPNLQNILTAAVAQACEECSMLLGQELQSAQDDALNTNKATYFGCTDDAMRVAIVESREDYPGRIFMVFTLRDAILLSGLMLGIPPARINEKRRLAIMEPDDTDAFGEIMNQLIGSFNSIVQPKLAKKSHLKLISHKKFVPGIDELTETEPLPEAEYFLCRFRLTMPGHEMDRLDILVPQELACLFDPPAEVAETPAIAESSPGGAAEKIPVTSATVSAGGAVEELEGAIIVLEDDTAALEKIMETLTATGLKLLTGGLGTDIRDLFSQGDVKAAIVGVKHTDDHELSLCIKLTSFSKEGHPLPIIMCANQWTRSSVLKALKYGARDILLKPYNTSELLAKITKYLEAA
jgi:CheY-like chemotaxis protein